jgi:hypothetical protein
VSVATIDVGVVRDLGVSITDVDMGVVHISPKDRFESAIS